jgi:hypothetical protein
MRYFQIFKLCGYYHANHHKTNYHHHKHNINHLHTVNYLENDTPNFQFSSQESFYSKTVLIELFSNPKVLYDGHTGSGSGGEDQHHVKEFLHSKPPKGHPSEYIHG